MINPNSTEKIAENVQTIGEITKSSIDGIVTSVVERLPYIVAGVLVLLIFIGLSKILRYIFWSASGRTKLDNRLRILFSRLIFASTLLLGIFAMLTVIIPTLKFGDLITGLGFTSFIIGFAAKDILNNLFSGVLILWQQPFRLGDYIFVGSNQGKVEYIGVRATQLRKDDGELILIPNGEMYSSALTIRSAGSERRMVLKINVDYDTDISHAKKIVSDVLNSVKGVVEMPKPKVVVTDLTESGINLSVYFWINTDKDSPLEIFDEVATKVEKSLREEKIVLFSTS